MQSSNKNYSATTEDYERLTRIVVAIVNTLAKLRKEFETALDLYIEDCLNDEDLLPEWLLTDNYQLEYELSTSALLHHLNCLLTLSTIARVSGINERKLRLYALEVCKPRSEKRKHIIDGIHQISKELESVA